MRGIARFCGRSGDLRTLEKENGRFGILVFQLKYLIETVLAEWFCFACGRSCVDNGSGNFAFDSCHVAGHLDPVVAVLAPVCAPRVGDNPVLLTSSSLTPAGEADSMAAADFGARADTVRSCHRKQALRLEGIQQT